MLREVLQNRQSIPEPHGSVLGNPRDLRSVKEYTAAERLDIARELNEAAREHDKEVVEQLKQTEEHLRITGDRHARSGLLGATRRCYPPASGASRKWRHYPDSRRRRVGAGRCFFASLAAYDR